MKVQVQEAKDERICNYNNEDCSFNYASVQKVLAKTLKKWEDNFVIGTTLKNTEHAYVGDQIHVRRQVHQWA